jgi:transmembrane sensor
MTKEEMQILADRVTSGMATEEEILLFDRMYNSLQPSENKWDEEIHGNKEEIEGSLKNVIWERTGMAKPVVRMTWYKWVAAAAVLIVMIGTAAYFAFYTNHTSTDVARATPQKERFKNDILPGGNKAVLTLADGSTIVLDDAQNGALAQQGNTKVIKLGGKLSYDPENGQTREVLYNTIATPRGGQYQIALPDGSQVWLNAASSLRFPTAFVGSERRVEITGEAYFEVAKNRSIPFVVSVNGAEVQVLGTHFDVMAYQEENAVKTTLLEGTVRFVSGSNNSLLTPGQQSQLTKEGQIKVLSDVDVEEVMAWKNGMFDFEKTDIETVMRQLSRWYNVEVVFKNKKEYNSLTAELPRNTNLSDVLKVLELSGSAQFDIQGNKIIVTQ